MIELPPHEKPCATGAMTSYRYQCRGTWIMIAARTDSQALHEATRSLGKRDLPAVATNLQIWDRAAYVPAERLTFCNICHYLVVRRAAHCSCVAARSHRDCYPEQYEHWLCGQTLVLPSGELRVVETARAVNDDLFVTFRDSRDEPSVKAQDCTLHYASEADKASRRERELQDRSGEFTQVLPGYARLLAEAGWTREQFQAELKRMSEQGPPKAPA